MSPEGLDPKQAHVVSQWPHDRPLVACRFDPAGQFVFCGSEDAVVERFKLADGARTEPGRSVGRERSLRVARTVLAVVGFAAGLVALLMVFAGALGTWIS